MTYKTVFLIGFICLVSVIAFDEFYLYKSVFEEGWPNFTNTYIIRTIVIFLSIIAIVWSLIGGHGKKFSLSESDGVPIERGSILFVMIISVSILFLFIFESSTFNALSREDNIVEWASALFLFGSCFITIICFVTYNKGLKSSKTIRFSFILLSLVFFITGMEEISWFQRVIGIETPEFLKANAQKEMNFHNFATNYIENIYYFVSFVFLVVLPFMRSLFQFISSNKYLKTFVARPFIAIIGSIAFAYNFDMWNGIFTQITFFGSLIILFVFYNFSSVKNERYLIIFAIILLITSQLSFLVYGGRFQRIWEVTEYKEFLIPLTLIIYSLDLLLQIKKSLIASNNTIAY